MSNDATFSVRLPEELRREVDEFAKATKRSRSFVVKEAIEAYIDDRRAYLEAIDEAIKEADKGVFISGEAVDRWLASWGTDNPLPMPEPDIFPDPKK
jgi:predicted transcriptional regulator